LWKKEEAEYPTHLAAGKRERKEITCRGKGKKPTSMLYFSRKKGIVIRSCDSEGEAGLSACASERKREKGRGATRSLRPMILRPREKKKEKTLVHD